MQIFQNGWARLWIVFTVIWGGGVWMASIYASSLLVDSNLHHKDQYLDSVPISLIVHCTDDQSKSECEKNVKKRISQPNGYVLLMRVGSDSLDDELASMKYKEALTQVVAKKRGLIEKVFPWMAGAVPILVLSLGGCIYWVMRGFKQPEKAIVEQNNNEANGAALPINPEKAL